MNSTDTSEDFGNEENSEENVTFSENSIAAINAVSEALEEAAIDIDAGKIVWSNGERLTIFQSIQKISEESGVDANSILEHIGHWLTMMFLMSGTDPGQMKIFCENSGMESDCDK